MNASSAPTTELARFDRTERVVHWTTALLGLALILTGAALYAGPISTAVGRRELMRNLHVLAGLALPVPLITALLLPRRGAMLRRDARELGRFDDDDRAWFRPRRRSTARPAKFNAGQKLNAAFLAGATIVLFATGLMLRWPDPFSVDLRTGVTFVHDWFAIAVTIAVAGHVVFAMRDPEARRGMRRGRVSTRWARRTHPRWYERVTGLPADRLAPPPNSSGEARAPR